MKIEQRYKNLPFIFESHTFQKKFKPSFLRQYCVIHFVDNKTMWIQPIDKTNKTETEKKKRISRKSVLSIKQAFRLTPIQREILVGILLGDGSLETVDGGKTYRLIFSQSLKKKEYVDTLYTVFQEIIPTPPKESERTNPHFGLSKSQKTYSYGFKTIALPQFRFYGHIFYKDGKKGVPKLIHRFLKPRGLAHWYMDDGSIKSKQSKGCFLNTQGFSKKDVDILIEVLQNKFHLKVSARKQKKKDGSPCYQIYISGHSFSTFWSLINSYILPCMMYKIPEIGLKHVTDKKE